MPKPDLEAKAARWAARKSALKREAAPSPAVPTSPEVQAVPVAPRRPKSATPNDRRPDRPQLRHARSPRKSQGGDAPTATTRSDTRDVHEAAHAFLVTPDKARRFSDFSEDEETAIILRYQAGDCAAGGLLIEMHAGFVAKKLRRYARYGSALLADLYQEARRGLLRAASQFDPTRGNKLITYAGWWIRHYVLRYLNEHENDVRLPIYLFDGLNTIRRHGVDHPKAQAQIAKHPVIGTSLHINPVPMSLDAPVEADSRVTLRDTIVHPDAADSPETVVGNAEEQVRALTCIREAMARLPRRERDILQARLMSEDDEEETHAKIGERYNLSRERIRQLERAAIQQIRLAILRRPDLAHDERAEMQRLIASAKLPPSRRRKSPLTRIP